MTFHLLNAKFVGVEFATLAKALKLHLFSGFPAYIMG